MYVEETKCECKEFKLRKDKNLGFMLIHIFILIFNAIIKSFFIVVVVLGAVFLFNFLFKNVVFHAYLSH